MVLTRLQQRLAATACIQRAFRLYLQRRYRGDLHNWDDVDPISQEPVCTIPRTRLFCLDGNGYDSWAWLRWFHKSETHPTTRHPISPPQVRRCYEAALRGAAISKVIPPVVQKLLEKYKTPLQIRHISIVSISPVRWYMMVYISPLYRLLYVNVEISQTDGQHLPTASVSYDVEERNSDCRIFPSNNAVSLGLQERTFVFGSDLETTTLANNPTTTTTTSMLSPRSTSSSTDSEFTP